MNSKEHQILADLLAYAERRTCLHEETHRGGKLWEICDACGAKWADDEGGKPAEAHEWPPEITAAHDLLRGAANALPDLAATSLLVHGAPAAGHGEVRVPFEFIPEEWEPDEATGQPHLIHFKSYTDEPDCRRGFLNCNPCSRDGSGQAALQHLHAGRLYFLDGANVMWRKIQAVSPSVLLDDNGAIHSAFWSITYEPA